MAFRASATTVNPPEFSELVNQSDYIVRAVVKSVNSEMLVSSTGRKIVTHVELEVKEVIAGTPPQPLVLEMLGGRVGDVEMTVDGAPRFAVNDEDILFVRGNGRQFTPLVALMHGRYPVQRDARTGKAQVMRNNRAPLRAVTDVAAPMPNTAASASVPAAASSGLSVDDFTRQIRATWQPSRQKLPR